MSQGQILRQFSLLLCFVGLFTGVSLPVQAQTKATTEDMPFVSQLSDSAGVLLPGKAWQNVQIGQTLPAGSEIITSVSGLQLSFLKAKITLSPFCHLVINRTGTGKKNLLIVVQAGQIFLTGNTKQVDVNSLGASQPPQTTQQPQTGAFSDHFSSPRQTLTQTYRILSPWMGL